MKTPANAKELLDSLHFSYVKRQTCMVSFDVDSGPVELVIEQGDIVKVRGAHFDEGKGFLELLRGDATNVLFKRGLVDDAPGHSVTSVMEMILFEMAAGMDAQLTSTLESVRKTGKLPPEVRQTAIDSAQPASSQQEQQQILLVEEGDTVIGRSASADLVVVEPTMSRKHAILRIQNRTAAVENVSTANGTFVNRKLIDSSPLNEGDLLSLGKTLFKFFWSDCGRGILFRMNEEAPSPEDMATFKIP